jgi:hypothetical protein
VSVRRDEERDVLSALGRGVNLPCAQLRIKKYSFWAPSWGFRVCVWTHVHRVAAVALALVLAILVAHRVHLVPLRRGEADRLGNLRGGGIPRWVVHSPAPS